MLDQSFHRFGPFIIVRTLGRGGMGEVFIARTPWPENPLGAVKRLRPDVARVPTFAERFKHEAELAVRLSHPNVVGTLDVGSVDSQLYVCSELVLGKDTGMVADRLRERSQGGPAAVAIRLMLDALAGLAYVHGAREPDGRPLKLVHRDITPGNVLIGYDGVARLADFGLAKSLLTERSKLTNHGEILGTPHYLAPEVIRGEGATSASDLYGLGAVMYRFLTGVAPHQGNTAEVLLKVLSEQPRPLSDLRPDLPPWIVAFVHRLLETDSTRRAHDAQLLLKQLTNDARQSGLLVLRSSVARWLGVLFEQEKADELEERDRIAAIDPESLPDRPEGTVVLARPRAGSNLQAPHPIDSEDSESQGTELELSEKEIRAAMSDRALAQDGKRRSAGDPDAELIPPSKAEAADAKRKLDVFGGSGTFDEDSVDRMPTRAVTVFPGGPLLAARKAPSTDPDIAPSGGGEAGAIRKKAVDEDTLDPEPSDEYPSDKTRAGPIVLPENTDSDGPSGERRPENAQEGKARHLPGFVDDGPRRGQARAEPLSAHPVASDRSLETDDDEAQRRARIKKVESPPPMGAPKGIARELKTSLPPESITPGRTPNRERARLTPEAGIAPKAQATHPKAPLHAGSSGRERAHPTDASPSTTRNLLVLAGLLATAISMGVAIGVLITSLKKPQPIVVESAAILKARLIRLKSEMTTRAARGEAVPAKAWELVVGALLALDEGNEGQAQKAVEEVERLLTRPVQVAPSNELEPPRTPG